MSTTKKKTGASAPKKVAKTTKAAEGGKTMLDLAEGYLGYLEAEGRSATTVFSYRMELKRAVAELGETTVVKKLTAKAVLGFFESDRVMKLRSGKPKNQRSIDKTRRVLRLALVWAVEQDWIEKTPIPVKEKKAKSNS